MQRNIYALLVGINDYKSQEISPLKGCINDVTSFEEYLQAFSRNKDDKLHVKKLINQDATRQGIINGFREYLCQAKNNDIVIFYFSGHGSKEQWYQDLRTDNVNTVITTTGSNPKSLEIGNEWVSPRYLEPERCYENETLVCWDSRTGDVWDLADKELAKLIAEVSRKNPHIVVILDSCHSGGAVRSENENTDICYTGIRSIEPDDRIRPISSFIFSFQEKSNYNKSGDFVPPKGEYIFLAACRDDEEAREHYSQKRGVFSYFLLDTLTRTNGDLNYRDLFKRTNALVRGFYSNQSPQIQVTNSSYLDQPFLGGEILQKQPYFTVTHHGIHGWNIDGGAVHGIRYSSNQERTRLAIFPLNLEKIDQLSNAIAVAEVTKVFSQISTINITEVGGNLKPELTYKAVITSLPLTTLGVYLEGEKAGINFAREAIKKASFGEQESLYISEVSDPTQAYLHLQASQEQYQITRPNDDYQLIDPTPDLSPESALQAIQGLEHIARWINIANISTRISHKHREQNRRKLYLS